MISEGEERARVVLGWLVAALQGGTRHSGLTSACEVCKAMAAAERLLAEGPPGEDFSRILRGLCVEHGYGAVMEETARQWRELDPVGVLSIGPCEGLAKITEAREAAADGMVILLADWRGRG